MQTERYRLLRFEARALTSNDARIKNRPLQVTPPDSANTSSAAAAASLVSFVMVAASLASAVSVESWVPQRRRPVVSKDLVLQSARF